MTTTPPSIGNKEIMAKNIRYYMDSRGIDRNKICADLNLKYTTFTDWINAKTYPRIDKIELQANKFAVELLLPDSYLIDIYSINLYSVAHASGIPLVLESLKFSCPI